jgi:hypothetical protein
MRTIPILLLLLLTTALSAQTKDCKQFRNGVFRIDDKEKGTSNIITRKGGRQHEKMGDDEVTLKVVWLNDCTYTLELIKEKRGSASNSKSPSFDPTLVIKVEILETGEGFYMQRSTAALYNVEFTSRVTRIK